MKKDNKTKIKITAGSIAPDFKLMDQDNKEHTLSNYRGHWVLLYFYPKDDTPGCTKEACSIRDSFPDFSKLKIKVFGVSVDSTASHKKFEKKYDLPFRLLADIDKEVVKLYGVWLKKKFMGREYMGTMRTSFVVDPNGRIVKIYNNVNTEDHAREVLGDMKLLKKSKK
ncbi:MAG: thioredoxin-dependent thiol peroxidase [Patescibacteria group bacterium]